MITLKYRRLSWYGVALIPGAAEAGERGRETKVPKRERRRSLRGGRRLVPSRSVARDSYDTMQRGRNNSQRARTRLTQKALGFLHDAPGEQAGVGHLGGRSAQQSTGRRVREAAHGAESAATAMAHRCLRGEQGIRTPAGRYAHVLCSCERRGFDNGHEITSPRHTITSHLYTNALARPL